MIINRIKINELVYLLPFTLLIGGSITLSLGFSLATSLGYAPWFGVNNFPNFTTYWQTWASSAFWLALAYTLYYAVISSLLATAFAILLAIAINKNIPFINKLSKINGLPLFLPYILGIALAIIMLGKGGIFSRLCAAFGIIDDPAQFPAILNTHYGWGIIFVFVWKQLPFLTLVISAALNAIPANQKEMAMILGANKWQILYRIILPQVMPHTASALVLCMAYNISSFEVPLILGGGYPYTLPVIAYNYYINPDYSYQIQAMVLIVHMAIISALFSYTYLYLGRFLKVGN
ncbi:ABC transporter permease [Polycladidibacter stylochi]|uniref:ABC transporter permease n=1 Tax=Polycladidibacter stylochi TaxID=1807766 RepID=UPI00082A19FA|nr:sugar ABC transporter permease [Pseudovibrio stylochi]